MNNFMNKAISVLTGIAMMISFTASVKTVAEDSTEITKWYKKYNFESNAVSNYSLSMDVEYSTQMRAIIGEDNRVVDGNDGVVYLSIGGTGFIIGDHTIATAAHCVNVKYADDQEFKSRYRNVGYFFTDLAIYLYDDHGSPESGFSLTPVEIHIPNQYLINDEAGSDYALITVEEDLSSYTHFNLGVPYDVESTAFQNLDLFVSGIPQTVPSEDPDNPDTTPSNSHMFLYTGKGRVDITFENSEEVLHYSCDMVGGQSGGPVYVAGQYTSGSTTETVYTAIAINNGDSGNGTGLCSFGSAITPYKLQFFKNNPNVLY